MRLLTVHKNDENQRLDKYLKKYLKEAPGSFIYKMLRKKNITLNGKKADGSERLSGGDVIRFFFSDETFATFAGKGAEPVKEMKILPLQKQRIIYEDENVLFYNKPAGLLFRDGSRCSSQMPQF